MGFTIVVNVGVMEDKSADGHFYGCEQRISISKEITKQVQEQTFWHEYMHCVLTTLGYDKLNNDEKFVDRMAQCLYQLEKTRKDRK